MDYFKLLFKLCLSLLSKKRILFLHLKLNFKFYLICACVKFDIHHTFSRHNIPNILYKSNDIQHMETQFVRNLERYFQDKSLQTQIDIALNTFNNCHPLNELNEKYSNYVQSVKSNKISPHQFYGWRNFKILHDLNCENCPAMSQIGYHYFVQTWNLTTMLIQLIVIIFFLI